MKWLIFAIPCALLIAAILQHVILPEQSARKFFADVQRVGFRRSQLNQSVPTLLIGCCFICSYSFVDFGMFWIALGIVAMFIPVFFLLHKRTDKDVEEMFSEVTEQTIARAVKKRRANAVWKLALLGFWCFSWLPPNT